MPRSTLILALAATALAGCLFQNLSPTQQLSDTVYLLNDETRWGRIDLAAQSVVPRFRARFVQSRHHWGRSVAVADTEVSALILSDDMSSATSTVEITWYDQQTMELRGTVLRQHWAKSDVGFLLDEESIVSGDETLLSAPEDEEDAAEEAVSGVSPARG